MMVKVLTMNFSFILHVLYDISIYKYHNHSLSLIIDTQMHTFCCYNHVNPPMLINSNL
jgi:hypothetical protein